MGEDDEKDNIGLRRILRKLNPFRAQNTEGADGVKRLPRAQLEVSKTESVFISVSNVLIVVVIIIDLLFFIESIDVSLPLLTGANLLILALAFTSYLMKRRILRRALRKK